MKRSDGFTVIEIIVAVVFLGLAVFLVLSQKNTIETAQRDDKRKTAINAMYYNLEEVYYAQKGSYPAKIDSSVLKAMDPALFTDPNGVQTNTAGSDYRYTPANCTNDACKSYTLSSKMEKEADYTKTSRNH